MLDCMAIAFLKRGGEYLLMKRSQSKRIAPGVWCGVGGHMERDELNEPKAACLREIYEETGIGASRIQGLTLRYIIIRQAGRIVRQNYIYFGETDAEPPIETYEGELRWVAENELTEMAYSATFTQMIRHYINAPDPARVVVGVASSDAGMCRVTWTALEDFDIESVE
jgi:8-oxo-dGTP diphosphatase